MNLRTLVSSIFCISFIYSISLFADTIVLKNGLKLEGKFKGGTETSIKFETSGAVQEIAITEITSLTFSEPPAQSSAAPATTTAPPPSKGLAASGAQIPVGTKIMIKTQDAISTKQHKAGAIFTAAIENDVLVNGQVAIPKGSTVYGKVVESSGGRRIGNQRIIVNFDRIMINNQNVDILTDNLGAEGGAGGAVKMVGAGALIGHAAGSASKGAAVGAGVALLAGGKHIQIPPNSLVEVELKAAVNIP